VWWERRREQRNQVVLTHLGLFGIRSFRYGAIAALIVALGEFGMLFALPLVLQGAMGYSALGTGWLILSLAVGTFVMSGAVPQITNKIGQTAVVRIGLGLEAVAILGLAVVLPGEPWQLALLLFVYGAGVGMATAQLTSVILSQVPVARSGEASGLQTTVRQLGSALGVALLGGLLITSLTSGTEDGLAKTGMPASAQTRIVDVVHGSVGAAIPALEKSPETAPAAKVASDALISAARATTGVAGGVLVLGLLATFMIPKVDEPAEAT
jgi:predicted MFS family arabinose efflux permease